MSKMVTNKDIGLKIKALRQQVGLSQEKLAEMVGVTFQQVQKYENGQTTLNVAKLQVIADALKVSVTEFFVSKPTEGFRLSIEEEELLRAYRRLKSEELKKCIRILIKNVNKRIA